MKDISRTVPVRQRRVSKIWLLIPHHYVSLSFFTHLPKTIGRKGFKMLEYVQGTLFGGRYRIVKGIGAGGMGAVYLATDPRFDDFEVALKVLYPGIVKTPELKERFKNEIIASYKILHRNVVRPYEYFDEDGQQAYVMEYVKGQDLYSRLEEGALDIDQAIDVLYQIAAGLDAIHAAGILHRDLKPENIFLTGDGEVKIGDFGVVRLRRANGTVTQDGMLVGTPKYLAPEYIETGNCDNRSDLYALGVIAYEVVTGKSPFRSKSSGSLMMERFQNQVPPIKDVRPECPEGLIRIIEKAMALSPENRYQSAAEMRTDFGLMRKGEQPCYAVGETPKEVVEVERLKNLKMVHVIPEVKLNVEEKKKPIWPYVVIGLSALAVLLAVILWIFATGKFSHEELVMENGTYNGAIKVDEKYQSITIYKKASSTSVSIKGMPCGRVKLNSENRFKCGDGIYELSLEYATPKKVGGDFIDLNTGIEHGWNAEKEERSK